MGVTSSVQLETEKTVVKSVVDETVDGYESAYACYFEADGGAQLPFTASASKSSDKDDDHCE